MTGLPEFNFPAFHAAAKMLRAQGYDVVNPAELDNGNVNLTREHYMRRDIPLVCNCDLIYMLIGWEKSAGARLERDVAMECGLTVYYQPGAWQGDAGHDAPPADPVPDAPLPEGWEKAPEFWHCTICGKPALIVLKDRTKEEPCNCGLNAKSRPCRCPKHLDVPYPQPVPTPVEPINILKKVETVLEEAQRLVFGDRGTDYGHPYHDFSRTAKIWTGVLLDKLKPGVEVDPTDVALCMCGVKMSRQINKKKRDNLTDIAGYAGTAAMVMEYEEAHRNWQEQGQPDVPGQQQLFDQTQEATNCASQPS